MERLAIYDMDKTITRRPTWTPFLRAWARAHPRRLAGLAATAGPVALYLARRIDRARLKEMTQRLVMGRSVGRTEAARVAEVFPTGLALGRELLRRVIAGDLEVAERAAQRWLWDLQIAYGLTGEARGVTGNAELGDALTMGVHGLDALPAYRARLGV